ncbi:class E sortase [Streptomyces sp. P01-B04]|uniref:class E sortase n=1 Tax=Streptomyces poriferorum TaxID=2798799 RepID=UPI001C5DD551|nr:class E sortase [Streptomyces poriferorum]MBW5252328.1 class E sortase [Streptomyces poriferorum]MBW5260084.1 class E sortase [Streptomyces poriferorum]
MTPPRHGSDAGQDGPYEPGGFEAAVDHLADPLNDPLPARHASPWFRTEDIPAGQAVADSGGTGSPGSGAAPPQASHGPQTAQDPPREWYDPEGYERDWYGRQGPAQEAPVPASPVPPTEQLPRQDETVALRKAEPRRVVVADQAVTAVLPVTVPRPGPERDSGDDAEPDASAPATGGRAERRRAAKGRGRRRGDGQPETAAAGAGGADDTPPKPMSRVEARRAAKAAKDSPAVVVSRVVGELFISLGVLMLLFVTYQLWWTNVRADQIAGKETHKIQDDWANGKRSPGVFAPGEGFAIIHIPKLDVVTPIAEGISKEKVLDRGMVGHYGEEPLRTAMPSDKQGNFALAGHRNTHGEPFRYVNRLSPGDPIVVETQDAYYTYEMTSVLPQTSPSNVSVIGAVPPQSGFKKPGRYITLTTCTPEFTSTYRLIVWGKMVDERPRSKGKPDALLD